MSDGVEGARRFAAFVDRFEGDVAVLRVEGRNVELPRALLPEGAREGAWLELTVHEVTAPDDATRAEAIRRRLASDDDGGDFKL